MIPSRLEIFRKATVLALTGYKNSTLYAKIEKELLPPQIKLGKRASGWVAHEIDAVNAARIAGANEDQIRKLVRELVAARKGLALRYRSNALGVQTTSQKDTCSSTVVSTSE